MINEWRTCTLKEVIKTANTGLDAIKRAPIVDFNTGIKCLRIQDISQKKEFKDWGFCEVDKNNYTKYVVKKGDIYIARTGASIGVNLLIKENVNSVFNNGLIRLRINENIADYLYVFYTLCTYEYEGHIENISGGTSTQPNMQINALLDYIFFLPPLPTQRAIAEILSSLDDKIDLLTRQNATLEALVQTYFRQWFVEFETPLGRLDQIAQITMGQSPSGDSYNEEGRGTVFFQGRAEFGWRYPTIRLYTTEPQRMAKKGDILMSVRAPVGDINIATEDCCIGRGLASIHSDYPTFVLYALKEQTEQLAIFDGEGTVFGSITKEGLNGLDIHLPGINRVKEFETSFSILDKKIDNNTKQIQILQKLRDTLLPKLISGEVKVKQ